MGGINYYQVLGVSNSASREEIVRAYRRLARRFHPDVQPPEQRQWAEERMKQVNGAYDVLGDPAARARYDAAIVGSFSGPFAKMPSKRRIGKAHMLFWTLAIGSLLVGMYLFAAEWSGFSSLEELGMRALLLYAWWAVLVVVLLKVFRGADSKAQTYDGPGRGVL